jgi:hypothetical protein
MNNHRLFICPANVRAGTYHVKYSTEQTKGGWDLYNEAYNDRPDFSTLCYRLITGEGFPKDFFNGHVEVPTFDKAFAERIGISTLPEMEEKTIKGLVGILNTSIQSSITIEIIKETNDDSW